MKVIPTSDAEIRQLQENIQAAFKELPKPPSDPTQTAINENYVVKATDEFIFVDSRRGALTISLPAPGTRTVTIRNVSASTNAVNVQAANALPINQTQSIIQIEPLTTKSFRYDNQTRVWWTT